MNSHHSHDLPGDVRVSDLNIVRIDPLDSPAVVKGQLALSEKAAASVLNGRIAIREALSGANQRPVVIAGPCSIHDPKAALEYAEKLAYLARQLANELRIVMRVYFEKPRTTVGWKGLINDPLLNGSEDINLGLRTARRLLLDINSLGLPCATEFLDPIVPQYLADLVSWVAIGARTTESQTHREMASGLSMPVGFKNGTDGDLQIALDAMTAAAHGHSFLGINQDGATAIVRTSGNPDVHLVLRGGHEKPNYGPEDIADACRRLGMGAKRRPILIDCSHGNSSKDYRRQPEVFNALLDQITTGSGPGPILGMMLESNLSAGNQKLVQPENLKYGISVTDGCIDWATTETLLLGAANRLKKG